MVLYTFKNIEPPKSHFCHITSEPTEIFHDTLHTLKYFNRLDPYFLFKRKGKLHRSLKSPLSPLLCGCATLSCVNGVNNVWCICLQCVITNHPMLSMNTVQSDHIKVNTALHYLSILQTPHHWTNWLDIGEHAAPSPGPQGRKEPRSQSWSPNQSRSQTSLVPKVWLWQATTKQQQATL